VDISKQENVEILVYIDWQV